MFKSTLKYMLMIVTVVGVFGVAACGNSDSSGKSSGSSGGSSASSGKKKPDVTPLDVAPAASNKAEIVRQIQAEPVPKQSIADIVAKDQQSQPTAWQGPTEPVKPPPGKKKLALISCASVLHGCVTPLIGAAAAAKSLGWTSQTYDGGGTPDTANKVILSALSSGADAILFTSINPALIQQGLEAAKRAHVPVISGGSGSSEPDPTVKPPAGNVWPLLDVSQSYVETGRQMADWIINDSKGKANVLVLTDKEYTSGISQAGAVDEFNKLCPDCKLDTFDFTGTQAGTTLPKQTVGYLRTHPDVNYVVTPYDPSAAAIVPAMAQAGQTSVKLCGLLGDQQNLDFIRNGQVQTCDAAYDQRYTGWAMVDQLLRQYAGKPLSKPLGENVPSVLLDKSNLPKEGSDWVAPFDYPSQFKQLWGAR